MSVTANVGIALVPSWPRIGTVNVPLMLPAGMVRVPVAGV